MLLRIARRQLEEALFPAAVYGVSEDTPELDHPWLLEHGAVFVTLRRDGQLRGCLGTLEAHRSLIDDVRQNVLAAAESDPRFPPVETLEFAEIQIEVTELSPPECFPVASEADALSRLRPGIDGVVLEWGRHNSTFLPQVWEVLPEPEHFLAALKEKAGLERDFWDSEVSLRRYQARKWCE